MKKSYYCCSGTAFKRRPEAKADYSFTGAGVDSLWTNPANWEPNEVPDNDSTGAAFDNDQTHVILDAASSAICQGFMLGMYGATNSGQFHGGTLDCQWLDVGRANENGGNGTFSVNGGAVAVQNQLSIPNQFDDAQPLEVLQHAMGPALRSGSDERQL